MRLPEVIKLTGFRRSQIYRLVNIGEFPKQVKISSKSVAWLESELEEWMDKKIQESRNNNPGGKT